MSTSCSDDNDSNCSYSETVLSTNALSRNINLLMSSELDNVLDIYDDFRERFSMNPFFIANMTCIDLWNIITDCLYNYYGTKVYRDNVQNNLPLYTRFIQEHSSELQTSYHIMWNYLDTLHYRLSPHLWGYVCFYYSVLSDL